MLLPFQVFIFIFKDEQFPEIGHNYDSTTLPFQCTFSVKDPACESTLWTPSEAPKQVHELMILLKFLHYFLMDFKLLEVRIVIFALNIIDTWKRHWMDTQLLLCALGKWLPALVRGRLQERISFSSSLSTLGSSFCSLSSLPCCQAQACLLYMSFIILSHFSTMNLLILCCRQWPDLLACLFLLIISVMFVSSSRSSFSKEYLSFVCIS